MPLQHAIVAIQSELFFQSLRRLCAVIRLSPYSQSHGLAGHCPRQLISELQVSLAPPTLFSSRDRSIKPTARGA